MRVSVISSLFGGYDHIAPPPPQTVNARWVMVTDEPKVKGWEVIRESRPNAHPRLAAKVAKCLPFDYTDDDVTVWMDASCRLTRPDSLERILDSAMGDIAQIAHPDRDCAPGDQLVRTVNRGDVRIDELVDGVDRLVSWAPGKKGQASRIVTGPGRGNGGYNYRRAVRPFTGDLVVMTTDETRTRVTPNHWVAARLTQSAAATYAVYLMRKGDWWRIGKTQLLNRSAAWASGPAGRARGEGADALWILGVYEDSSEALLAEDYFSAAYGVTQAQFRNPTGGVRSATVPDAMRKDLHERLARGGSGERARQLLMDLGLEVGHPIWPHTRMGTRLAFKIRAANLIGGWMEVLVADAQDREPRWQRVTVNREPVVGLPVYSLDVEPHHTYIGDGQVLYNCIYDEAAFCLTLRRHQDQPLAAQADHYRRLGHPEHAGLWAGGLIVRRNTPTVREFGARWLAEQVRWSCRDQVSQAPVAVAMGIEIGTLPFPLQGSGVVDWVPHRRFS